MQRGFSLLELSIVLVIIGLITGGVFVGQSLVRAAEVRSVTDDFARFRSAVQLFDTKFGALPGDMPNAVKFWGAAAGGTADGIDAACTALTSASPSTTTATCNGDGNGKIVTYAGAGTHWSEMNRFWQQLANEHMIEGTYTGVPGPAPGSNDTIPGTNAPESKISGAGFSTYYVGSIKLGDFPFLYPGEYGNVIVFGGYIPGYETLNVTLTPAEAKSIDKKMDDGKPSTGLLMTRPGGAPGGGIFPHCATTDAMHPDTAEYELTYDDKTCALEFIQAF